MKTRSILLSLLIVTLPALSQEQTVPVFAQVSWEKTSFDLGKIEQNKAVKVVFKFKNVGSIPVQVKGVSWGSNCSILQYPNQPVLPGETGLVEIEFDAKVVGFVSKSIKIKMNTETPETELYFNAIVKGIAAI
jgi:hypothetical protein